METTKLIAALTDFYNGKEVKTFGGAKSAIEHHKTWKVLKRIWNDGHGLIDFAIVANDNTLLINAVFCRTSELKDIVNNLNVKYEFVFLSYPDYYHYGLQSIRGKYTGESWGKKIPVKA